MSVFHPKSGSRGEDEVGARQPKQLEGPADLTRQLNLVMAQGLVVLQQWG
jgi:hypothetical protein